MNIIDELRREFPGWNFKLNACGDRKSWKGTDEPKDTEYRRFALFGELGSGRFFGEPLDGDQCTFPTLLEAAEYALGEKAESTKARDGTVANATPLVPPVLTELMREFPTLRFNLTAEGDLSVFWADDTVGRVFNVLSIPTRQTIAEVEHIAKVKRASAELVIDADAPPDPPSIQIRPAHYGGTSNPYECIKVIRAWGLNFELGNVAKYLSRAGKKPGVEAVDDLRKLITYAQMEIERLETKP